MSDKGLSESENNFKVIGTRPIRPDGIDKVTGRALYGADRYAPGMLVGKVLRSPHPHARIRAIDTSRAEALAGVKAIITKPAINRICTLVSIYFVITAIAV